MEKRQFVEQLIEHVRNLALSDVLSTRVQLHRSNMNHLAICPFHADRKLGSFVSTDRKKVWKCFSCGAGGDTVKFISMFDEISYLEAAFKIGLEHGLITKDEYAEYYTRRRYSKEEIERIQKQYEQIDIKNSQKTNIANDQMLDKVFRLFIDCATLSKEHENHLKKERKLSDGEIKEGMYFTFPSRSIMRRFMKTLEEAKLSMDVLKAIPGFYYDPKEEKWLFSRHKGIGIGIKNAKGHIVGIQIRRDEKGTGSRYVWFSSAFAAYEDKFEHGTSSGSPIDVIIPESIKNTSVIITEGRFKSQVLARETGSIVLSVQGVTAWRGIFKELDQLPMLDEVKRKTVNYRINTIMTAFDADISENIPVFEQLKQMTDAIEKKGYSVYYLYWNSEYGKGIDDLILSGNKQEIGRYDKAVWDHLHKYMTSMMLATTKKKTVHDVEKEVVIEYFTDYMMNLDPLKPGELGRKQKQKLNPQKDQRELQRA